MVDLRDIEKQPRKKKHCCNVRNFCCVDSSCPLLEVGEIQLDKIKLGEKGIYDDDS